MNIFGEWNWIWPAVMLAFCLGAMGMRWLYKRLGFSRTNKVNADYFKGLNFLLNEETDKAIESFIRALEVDDETVELHLALGGLFRRKGQLDRATRIHQNLIARPNLTERQRFEAIYELAQDYHKVGWLDRAEGLFDELKASETYRAAAINGLCTIYQQEKEWLSAINVLKEHKRSELGQNSKKIAHFYCELAETAIENLDFRSAKNYLSSADSYVKNNARIKLLKGEIAYQEKDALVAIGHWLKLEESDASIAQLIAGKMIKCYQGLGDLKNLEKYLESMRSVPRHGKDFRIWYDALVELWGKDRAEIHILQKVQSDGLSGPVANHLHHAVENELVTEPGMGLLLKELLNRAKQKKIEYTCTACGFDTKAMYWHCQNCGEWESFR